MSRPLHAPGAARRRSVTATRLLVACATLAATAPAWAHVESGRTGGFLDGLAHPVTGLDHVFAMVAVGLWGAQLGSPAIWLLPVTFPMVMALGGSLGLMGLGLPGVEIGIAISALVLGAAVVADWKPPVAMAMTLVGIFALFHGHAHGTELPEGQSPLLYSIGFVLSTGTLHAAGIALGLLHGRRGGPLLVRALGAVIALGGLVFIRSALS